MRCFVEVGEDPFIFFLSLRLSYCVSICLCILSTVEDWICCQLFCHVEALSEWIFYSRSLSLFMIYRNLSW